MRSPTKPWYRASKDAWYVQLNGRKVRLAKGRDNEKAAQQAFYKLMASGSGKLPEADTLRVATICDLFLDYSEKHHVPDTFRWYKDYLQDFCDLYGTLLVQDLKPLHVSRWLDAHPGWKGARRCAVIAIKRAFNWAEGEGLLAVNPLRKVKRLRQKLPHLKGLIAYAYRHSFATDALVNGVGIAQVAELLGHTSTEMVMRHYSHIAGKIDHMREAAMKAANAG
jgi:site-specific recombinase XerD